MTKQELVDVERYIRKIEKDCGVKSSVKQALKVGYLDCLSRNDEKEHKPEKVVFRDSGKVIAMQHDVETNNKYLTLKIYKFRKLSIGDEVKMECRKNLDDKPDRV